MSRSPEYSKWTAAALAAECVARGFDKRGLKSELIDRLVAHDDENRKRQKTCEAHEEMLDSLECPVCLSYMMPPFNQCCNGHIICKECEPAMSRKCPVCRANLASCGRNLLMEKVVATLHIDCPNDCGAKVSYLESKEHVDISCPLRKLPCPFARIGCHPNNHNLAIVYTTKDVCEDKLAPGDLVKHMLDCHFGSTSTSKRRAGEPFTANFILDHSFADFLNHSTRVKRTWKLLRIKDAESRDVHVYFVICLTTRGMIVLAHMLTPGFETSTYQVKLTGKEGLEYVFKRRVLPQRSLFYGQSQAEAGEVLRSSLAFPVEALEACCVQAPRGNDAGSYRLSHQEAICSKFNFEVTFFLHVDAAAAAETGPQIEPS